MALLAFFWLFHLNPNDNATNMWVVKQNKNMKNVQLVTTLRTGPHFLCWTSKVLLFNTWLMSNWEENNCCYKRSNCQNDNSFHSKWQLRIQTQTFILAVYKFSHKSTAVLWLDVKIPNQLLWKNVTLYNHQFIYSATPDMFSHETMHIHCK